MRFSPLPRLHKNASVSDSRAADKTFWQSSVSILDVISERERPWLWLWVGLAQTPNISDVVEKETLKADAKGSERASKGTINHR